jgi:hypothetical protein
MPALFAIRVGLGLGGESVARYVGDLVTAAAALGATARVAAA